MWSYEKIELKSGTPLKASDSNAIQGEGKNPCKIGLVNSKLNSNKDHNWEIINTMLNPNDNTVHFIIGRIKPQQASSNSASTGATTTTPAAS